MFLVCCCCYCVCWLSGSSGDANLGPHAYEARALALNHLLCPGFVWFCFRHSLSIAQTHLRWQTHLRSLCSPEWSQTHDSPVSFLKCRDHRHVRLCCLASLRETWESTNYLCKTAAWHRVALSPCKAPWPRMGHTTEHLPSSFWPLGLGQILFLTEASCNEPLT